MTELRVELWGKPIGRLISGKGLTFDFVATPDSIREHGLGSHVLSLAIPLVPRSSNRSRRIRENFFTELLPEGDARTRLANEAGVQKDDTLGMLRAYGRDVAGALQIWDPADPGEPRTPQAESLQSADVERLLLDVANVPLGNRPRRGKTSLPGVQNKILLAWTGNAWAQALDGYPTSHILKPIVPRYPTMIFDEEYGSRFARAVGLAAFDTTLERFGSTYALVVERYDRDPSLVDGRIHQEDFSQILGLSGDHKYETWGGAGLSDVARQLNDTDRVNLLKMVTLSVAVGNLDLHAKNISVLHLPDGSTRLAPMYDIVPQTHQDNDGEMAFRVGGEFEHRLISRAHLVAEAELWSASNTEAVIDDTLAAIARIAADETPHLGAHHSVRHDVLRFTTNLIAARAAGDSGDGLFDPSPIGLSPRNSTGGWAAPLPPTTPDREVGRDQPS